MDSFGAMTVSKKEHRYDLPSLEPLLIPFSGRNGSTLLMQVLATSPQIIFDRVYPFETRYLTYLLRWAQMLGQDCEENGNWNSAQNIFAPLHLLGPFPHQPAEFWTGQELWPKSFASTWREFSQNAIARGDLNGSTESSPLYYAEKVPLWVPVLLKKAGMSYRMIMLVRDPRDVFLSVTAFDKKRGFPGFNRSPDDDDWTFAERFVKDYQDLFKFFREEEANPSAIVVRYERLVLDVADESERLDRWLKVKLDASVVEKQISQFVHHITSKSPRDSVERWRRELPEELNEFFLREMGEWLRYFGYET
jgi:hypothetical protein